jgi:hypothetical protein
MSVSIKRTLKSSAGWEKEGNSGKSAALKMQNAEALTRLDSTIVSAIDSNLEKCREHAEQEECNENTSHNPQPGTRSLCVVTALGAGVVNGED